MQPAQTALDADWLGACRRATAGLRGVFGNHPTTRERAVEVGVGQSGDRSLVIDRDAEAVVFAELESMQAQGHRFCAVSEERGEVDFGDSGVRVVIDPIDGSLNAKRGVGHYSLSIAVADGPTMADVVFGYVYDFGPGEEWVGTRGGGAWLNGERLDSNAPERRTAAGKLEIVGIEQADPRLIAESIDALVTVAHRLRAVGSIAVSLCQVAAARFDGAASLRNCRSFDAAAAQLIVREAGGVVAFPAYPDPLGAPLDLLPHSPVLAARTAQGLVELCGVPGQHS